MGARASRLGYEMTRRAGGSIPLSKLKNGKVQILIPEQMSRLKLRVAAKF